MLPADGYLVIADNIEAAWVALEAAQAEASGGG